MSNDFPTHWTSTTLRVRYAETDQMGVVYYANYFVWFEIGRSDHCRRHGFAYREMEQQDGLYIIVAEARCRYKAPAHYDDEIVVRTCLRAVRKRVLVFAYEVYRQANDELLAEGETVHVVTDRDGRPRSLPDKYRELFAAGAKAQGSGGGETNMRVETRVLPSLWVAAATHLPRSRLAGWVFAPLRGSGTPMHPDESNRDRSGQAARPVPVSRRVRGPCCVNSNLAVG